MFIHITKIMKYAFKTYQIISKIDLNLSKKFMLNEFKSKVSEIKIKLRATIEFFLLWFLYLIGWITLIGITFNNIKITSMNKLFQTFKSKIDK